MGEEYNSGSVDVLTEEDWLTIVSTLHSCKIDRRTTCTGDNLYWVQVGLALEVGRADCLTRRTDCNSPY